MTNYYILVRHIQKGDIWIESYKASDSYEWQYNKGIPIEMTDEVVQFSYKYKTAFKTDYLAGIHSFPVVSQRFKEVLISLKTDPLEFRPVDLVCSRPGGDIDHSYFFLNILDNLECFDWEQSLYERLPVSKAPTDVTKLVVHSEKLKDRNIVRIAEIPSLILVGEKLRQLVESEKITGISFQSLDDYNEYEF